MTLGLANGMIRVTGVDRGRDNTKINVIKYSITFWSYRPLSYHRSQQIHLHTNYHKSATFLQSFNNIKKINTLAMNTT